jgi:hypothetical protein
MMIGQRDNGIPRPAGDQAGHTTQRNEDGAAPAQAGAQTLVIKVQCPNPACGKVHGVKTSWAGKTGGCPDCGTLISVPNVTAAPSGGLTSPAPSQSREKSVREKRGRGIPTADARPAPSQPREKSVRRPADVEGGAEPWQEFPRRAGAAVREVRAGCIGRGHAGKTALFRALGEGPVGDFFPSGLHVDVGDPREVAQMIREAEQTQSLLQRSGLPPTLQASQVRYYLYDGEAQRVAYQMREVIGQVLTHTLPDSTAAQQTRYGEYLKSLVSTHVLWAVVPCPPPNPGARERRRYANDLRITLAYLREALRLRSLEQPVAVALVLSKIDTLFKDAEEARASLPDDVLRRALGPLVHLIETSARVSDAAIIPVTAFGFGNAVLSEPGGEREGTAPESADEPFGAEPIWLLREGVAPHPFNLDTLFLWTLLFGLLNQEGPGIVEAEPEMGEMCRMLGEDLSAGGPWLLPLKGGRGPGDQA